MSKRTEGRKVVTVGEKITQVNTIEGGKAVEILFSVSESDEKKSETVELNIDSQKFERMFPIVDIENVSLEDSFMQYDPKTNREKRIKASIIEAKRIGMKNFRIPATDLSLDDDGETIIYCEGRKPAVAKSLSWWDENASKFMPNKNSRMRDDLEHDVVLGVMCIKYLVEEKKYKVEEAWKAKCFNLENTSKIIKKRGTSDFMIFGVHGNVDSYEDEYVEVMIYNSNYSCNNSVAEIVLDV